jgi:hypothetical protein
MKTKQNVYNFLFSKNEKVELQSEQIELAIRDKFIKKMKAVKNNPSKFASKIDSIRADIKKGIKEVGDVLDEAKKVQKGLASLGLKDEANDMKFAVNDAQNDFDELVYMNSILSKL